MMSAATAMFYLMLIAHSGDGLSLTNIKQFPSQASCATAASAVQAALGDTKGVEIGCISAASLEALKAANR